MTARAGVIGWPIHHSKSPIIHAHWLDRYGIAGSYDAIAVAPENLRAEIARLVREGYAGFNVTVPHKQAVMDLMDFVRSDAERIGAVNTVVVNPDGTLEGRNTDAFGFIANLRENAAALKGPAVILGAGGAARAVVYGLLKEGITDIRIANRTLLRARELAAVFPPATGHSWDALPELMQDAGMLVNTTSLGMAGQPPLEIDLSPLPGGALVHDIVYAPLETGLLQQARRRGNPVVTGIGMLLHQARPAFEAWFGVLPEVDDALARKVLG